MTPEQQLDGFLAKFYPERETVARHALAAVDGLVPGAWQLVYDAYSALSVCFSASDALKGGFVHIATYPKHVNLGFNQGATLPDPERRLQGKGKAIRHLRYEVGQLDDPYVASLV